MQVEERLEIQGVLEAESRPVIIEQSLPELMTTSTRFLAAQRDTYVTENDPAGNFGAALELRAQWYSGTDDEMVALLRFDTSDILTQTEIIAAYLSLVLTGTQESDLSTISVHEVIEPWEEMTVTWETQPPYAADPVVVTDVPTATERHAFWDITPLVQGWVSDPAFNHGLALRVQTDGSSRVFGSRESDAVPMLTLAYAVPPIEWPEPPDPPLPPHITTTLPVSDTAYLRWDGYEGRDVVREDPGPIFLSFNTEQYVMEARLFSFDLSAVPTDTEVYEARLELYLEGGENPEPVRIIAYMMDVPWSGQTASMASTFSHANEETDAPRGVASVTLDEPHWISLDVTKMVQKWVSGSRSNFGLLLRGADSTEEPWSRRFAGREAANAPRLVILRAPEGYVSASSTLGLPSYSSKCPFGKGMLFLTYGARKQWATIQSFRVISGTVSNPRVSHTEFPSTHDGHDLIFDILWNTNNAWAMSKANPNAIEIEWEHRIWPMWAWPSEHEHVTIFGPWIADCGHDAKTEIHPPRGAVVLRKQVAADISSHGGLGTVLVNRADVFFSNRRTRAYCGGFCENALGFDTGPAYVPLNDRDYEFDLYPPDNRPLGATPPLIWWREDHSYPYGTSVTPQISVVGSGANAHLHVKLPYKGKSGSLHTATSIYIGWSRTTAPDLRAFKVQVHGMDIEDDADDLLGKGEWYVWIDINGQWFDLGKYGIYQVDSGDYYGTNKDLVAHVIVPNTSDGKIRVRARGYEADCFNTLYGMHGPPGAELLALGACYFGGDDNDRLQEFDEWFTKSKGFGVGAAKIYNAKGDNEGTYGLKLSITEEQAPFQFRSMEVGVGDPNLTQGGMTLDGWCTEEEYADSQAIEFELSEAPPYSPDEVQARAAYDNDALYVCLDGIPATPFDQEQQQAVIYLDPGNPSKPKLGPTWVGRDDDLRIAFQTKPAESLIAQSFDTNVGWYKKPVASGLVTATSITFGDGRNIEFRIAKSLIPRGPWSAVPEQSLLNKGIGALIAIERPTESRRGAWPHFSYPTKPEEWGRMVFVPACPVALGATRIGEILDIALADGKGTIKIGGNDLTVSRLGDQATVVLDYQVDFDHPRCNLINGTLEPHWPGELKPVQWTRGGTYTGGRLIWALPSTPRQGKYFVTLQQYQACWGGENPPLYANAWGALDTDFNSAYVPHLSTTSNDVPICKAHGAFGFPDLTMWPKDWPFGAVHPWFLLWDPPPEVGNPMDIMVNVRNPDDFARRIMVKTMVVPAGVSSSDVAANHALDFSSVQGAWYTVPANATIAVHQSLNLPAARAATVANGTTEAVAVQISQPDGGGPPQVAVRQVIPYLNLIPGEDNVFPVTVWHTIREPADLHLEAVANCPGWEASVEPDNLPTQNPGTPEIVQVHLRPPEGTLLGSGCPVDIVAWTDTGEFAGSQRILDLPPVQASPDQPPFASREIELEPLQPVLGDEVRVCATVRNRADTPVQAKVLLGMSDRLSTAPSITEFFTVPLTVTAAGIGRACSEPFGWTGDRSFQAIIQLASYEPQNIHRHVSIALVSQPIPRLLAIHPLRVIPLEVRNPLTTTEVISLTYTLVGLPGWQVEMPAAVTLGPGEAVNVDVKFTSPETETRPGDEGRVEIWTHTSDGQIVGGVWLQVWKQGVKVYLPLILKSYL